jgi:hypothetical protein
MKQDLKLVEGTLSFKYPAGEYNNENFIYEDWGGGQVYNAYSYSIDGDICDFGAFLYKKDPTIHTFYIQFNVATGKVTNMHVSSIAGKVYTHNNVKLTFSIEDNKLSGIYTSDIGSGVFTKIPLR